MIVHLLRRHRSYNNDPSKFGLLIFCIESFGLQPFGAPSNHFLGKSSANVAPKGLVDNGRPVETFEFSLQKLLQFFNRSRFGITHAHWGAPIDLFESMIIVRHSRFPRPSSLFFFG